MYDRDEIRQIADDLSRANWDSPPLSEADRAMLKYVHKLTVQPGDIDESDIAPLRDAGFDDRAIGDIAVNCALFAFFTRIVDGLGATLEPGMVEEAERIGLSSHMPAAAD